MKAIMTADRIGAALSLLLIAYAFAPARAEPASPPVTATAPAPPLPPGRFQGGVLKPVPGAKPLEGVNIPAPNIPTERLPDNTAVFRK